MIGSLSVAENIFLGREQEFLRFGLVDKRRMNEAARVELAKVQLAIDPATRCEELSFAQRQMVEIAKALSLDSRIDGEIVILLDEPTSVLEQREIDLLFEIVRELKSRAAIVFISHRLDEVLARSPIVSMSCATVPWSTRPPPTVLPSRICTPTWSAASCITNITASNASDRPATRWCSRRTASASTGAFDDISLTLHEGEVIGIAGVVGSGREALARCLAGLLPAHRGTVRMDGEPVRIDNPSRAVINGLGFAPSERKAEGLVTGLSVTENITLASIQDFVRRGFLETAAEEKATRQWIDKLSIRTPSPHTPIASLSGGNQQKVVLAKWRVAGSRVLILDHPTRGIDVGAKEDVYELVRDMTGEGLSILLLADTLEEVIGLSSRIIVMRDGRISATFEAPPGGKPEQVDIVGAMV